MRRSKARYFIEFLIHALFWLLVYFALKAITASAFQMLVNDLGRVMSQDGRMPFPYGWVVVSFLALLFYSTSFWLFKKTIRHKSISGRVAVIAGWLALLYASNYMAVQLLILPGKGHLPPPGIAAPVAMPSGRFAVKEWIEMQPIIALIFILLLGVAAAYFFISERIKSELTRSQAEAHQLNSELKFLRSQVNPHFLFNTLNNLFSMAQKEGKDNLADKIAKLSGMMRYMLYESNTDNVPLAKEISYLEDCIALHQMRYVSTQVEVRFRAPGSSETEAVQVAPMLFIPFLENAFKHGTAAGHRACIDMVIAINQKKLTFTCVNTDHSAIEKSEAEKGGIGLENVRRRLELVYPGRHKLSAGAENGKYLVNLQIDLS